MSEPDWERAKELWAKGGSKREIAAEIGCAPETVRGHAIKGGWLRDSEELERRDEERRQRTAAATAAAEASWANRRSKEADAAGIVAGRARQAIIAALDARDDKMTRASAVAYGILIDKAQLLSGAATSRVGAEDPRERAASILDELAEKRREREAG